MKVITLSSLLVLLYSYEAIAVKLPGHLVYVVTPSSQPRIDEGRSAPQPFYYHNWMRRMDSPSNATSTTTTTTTAAPMKVMTPDLIFAEFESDKMKNIRKLLEKERIDRKSTTKTTTTTMKPIYVPNDELQEEEPQYVNYAQPSEKEEVKTNEKDMTDYFALYNNMYNVNSAPAAPVYLPKTSTTTPRTTTTSTTTTTPAPVHNVENIWNIIDSQKEEQYTGKWDEVPIGPDSDKDVEQESNDQSEEEEQPEEKPENYDNFALPGFGTNPVVGGENESRAIRTEPSIRFPYVNLKPFQMKNLKKPLLNALSNSKKGNNMFSLDDFKEVKNPVRGEAQEVPMREPIDRYNPAQPYLPLYGGVKKDTSYTPTKTVANLIPPPPPPPPKVTDNDFPAPSSYEQFPPFASPTSDNGPPPAPAPAGSPVQTIDSDDSDSGQGDDGPTPDLGYRYKPSAPPTQNFRPTLPPLQKPSGGYSYNKPTMSSYDALPPSYKPPMSSYDAPPPSAEAPSMDSDFQGYNYDKPISLLSKPEFSGYQYKKPEPSAPVAPSPSYGNHGEDYPELIFDKPHGGHGPKGGDGKGGADSMGMVPPPIHDVMPDPPGDSGFPSDFPGDFKYSHHFDDHDFHHHEYHHDHHPTTTTTEMPRVNRFSYYYLGKKLYYLPLYFSVYFIVYVGALIIKAVLRHKIVYPNSWRPNDTTATFFTKRSVDSEWDSSENLHEITGRVTRAIASAAERYMESKKNKQE